MNDGNKEDALVFGGGCLALCVLFIAPALFIGSIVGVVCLVLRLFGVL